MNRQTLSNLKAKIVEHTPEIVVTAVTVVGVAAAVYFVAKTSTPPASPTKRVDVGPILVLEERDADNNIYTDMDYPGVMYQVTAVS